MSNEFTAAIQQHNQAVADAATHVHAAELELCAAENELAAAIAARQQLIAEHLADEGE